MIETKITCQCGNHFKFGMDLVNGRAPDGLVCPTCGAPATAACNAFVDFLSGKEPAPPSTDTRPLKEVRVTCTCGARYKFDLELAESAMPAPVVCPTCQVDLTPLANEEIRSYVAKHAGGLAAAVVPVDPPAPVVTPAPEPSAEPPAVETVPASSPSPTPEPTPEPPASTTAPPPPESLPATTPAPAAPAVPTITPVSDPFGSPTGKSSGPNLKPLEVPKPNRPPPGSRPAAPAATKPTNPSPASAPAAKPSAPATTPPGKYTPAKPMGHHNQHAHAAPAANAREPSLGGGIGGAIGGALIGAGLWFGLLQATAIPTGWMAAVVGGLAGLGARLLGRSTGPVLGGAACGIAALVICLMAWLTMMRHVDRLTAPQLKAQYLAELANAQTAVKATDAELKVILERRIQNFGMGGPPTAVSDEEVTKFRANELPRLRDFAAGKPSRAEWEGPQRARMRSGYPLEDIWQEAFGIIGLLCLLSGIFAAAKIPMQ